MDKSDISSSLLERTKPDGAETSDGLDDSADELIIIQATPLRDDSTGTVNKNKNEVAELDELGQPMSMTQRVVVGLAIVGLLVLVAFLVLYWVFDFRFAI